MKSATDSEKWFRVSLRFQGDDLPLNEIQERLHIQATFLGRMGAHIKGNPSHASYSTNIWVADITNDSTVDFEEQIGDLLELLEPYKHEIEGILSLPGVTGEFFLGFSSSNGQGSAYFSPVLLSRISSLGLALNLDLYPPSSDDVD